MTDNQGYTMHAIFSVDCTDCKAADQVLYSGDFYMKKREEGREPENCGSCGSTNVKVKKVEEQI